MKQAGFLLWAAKCTINIRFSSFSCISDNPFPKERQTIFTLFLLSNFFFALEAKFLECFFMTTPFISFPLQYISLFEHVVFQFHFRIKIYTPLKVYSLQCSCLSTLVPHHIIQFLLPPTTNANT